MADPPLILVVDDEQSYRDALSVALQREGFLVETAADLLRSAGLEVEETHGVRVLADLLPATVLEEDPQAVLDLELALAAHPPFRDIASQLHLFARRP